VNFTWIAASFPKEKGVYVCSLLSLFARGEVPSFPVSLSSFFFFFFFFSSFFFFFSFSFSSSSSSSLSHLLSPSLLVFCSTASTELLCCLPFTSTASILSSQLSLGIMEARVELPPDFNSSDFEVSESEQPQKKRHGIAEAIIRNQAVDRRESKKSLRTLQFAHGAPGTRANHDTVIASWDAFCTTISHE
jgi:hypothetical protein